MMTKLMLLFVVTIALSGCATWRAIEIMKDPSCGAFNIIRPSPTDTMGTKRQVLAHNRVYRELCEK